MACVVGAAVFPYPQFFKMCAITVKTEKGLFRQQAIPNHDKNNSDNFPLERAISQGENCLGDIFQVGSVWLEIIPT